MTFNSQSGSKLRRFADENILHWNSLWLLLWTVGLGIFLAGYPKSHDDIWYLIEFRPWFKAQGIDMVENGGNIFTAGFPVKEWCDMLDYRFNHDNLRIVNMTGTFLLLFPKWIGSGLLTLMMCWNLMLGVDTSGYNWRRSAATPMLIFAFTFLLPWQDYFSCLIFQINYIVPTCLTMLLYRWLRRPHSGFGGCTAALLFGLLTGVCHEGFAAPAAAGLGALFCFYKSWRRSDVVWAIIGLALGTTLLMCVPGVMYRLNEPEPYRRSLAITIREMFTQNNFLYPLFGLLWAVAAIRPNRKKYLSDPLLTFAIVSSTALFVICLRSRAQIHASFWMDYISAVAVVRMVRIRRGTLFAKRDWKYAAAIALPLLLSYLHLVAVDYYSLRLRQIRHEAERHFLRTGDDYCFTDIYINKTLSPIAFKRPENDYPFTLMSLQRNFYDGINRTNEIHNAVSVPIFLVPGELEYATPQNSRSGGDPGIYEKDGFFFAEATPELMALAKALKPVPMTVKSDGYSHEQYTRPVPFRSKADGKEYVWFYYLLPWREAHFEPLPTLHYDD